MTQEHLTYSSLIPQVFPQVRDNQYSRDYRAWVILLWVCGPLSTTELPSSSTADAALAGGDTPRQTLPTTNPVYLPEPSLCHCTPASHRARVRLVYRPDTRGALREHAPPNTVKLVRLSREGSRGCWFCTAQVTKLPGTEITILASGH